MQDTPYVAFVLPLALIGTGFVLATTVRTAIVFAATPRGLAATAAGINEASVGLGARIGVVLGAVITSVGRHGSRPWTRVAGRPDAQQLLDEFETVLVALGTPRFNEVLSQALETAGDARQVKAAAFIATYFDGRHDGPRRGRGRGHARRRAGLVLLGRRDPLRTVFDMRDEREARASSRPQAAAARRGARLRPDVSAGGAACRCA